MSVSISISISKPQTLPNLSPLPSLTLPTPFSLLPFPPNPVSSPLLLRQRPFRQLHPRRHLSGFGASVLAQDSNLDGFEGELGDVGGRGGDWGLQEEVSDGEEREVEGGDGGRIFVGNLPFEIGSEELARLFEEAGEVEAAEVIYNRETDRSRGFGFVSMRTTEEAQEAINMFSGYDLGGRPLVVNMASSRGSQPIRPSTSFGSRRRIFVANLAWEVDGARLKQFFTEYGKVLEAQVIYEKDTGRSRGFGFVKMSTDQEIEDAIENLDGKDLDGRPVRVTVAEERRRNF